MIDRKNAVRPKPQTPAMMLADIIRGFSKEEKLATRNELRLVLQKKMAPVRKGQARLPMNFTANLERALKVNADLTLVTTPDGDTLYYSSTLISNTYASILAAKGVPCLLMAQEVRKNAKEYPRPVPLDMFEYPPFDFSPETVTENLKTMATDPAYSDIGFVESSVGTVYLFSSKYLEKDYAEFLAERADIGMVQNP